MNLTNLSQVVNLNSLYIIIPLVFWRANWKKNAHLMQGVSYRKFVVKFDVMIICIQHNLVIYSVCYSTNGYIFLPSISAYLVFKRNKVNWCWWFKSFTYCSAFNWTVPWLSVLAVVALSVITFILYMIPLRYIILLWGKCSGIELSVNCFK